MNYQDEVERKWKEHIIELGIELDSYQDGDARITTFTFNEAQLQAFVDMVTHTHSAHLVERLAGLYETPIEKEGEGTVTIEQSKYWVDGYNKALDQARDIVGKTNGM